MQKITFLPQLILRTPQAAFSTEINETLVRDTIQNNASFREALYLASPRLLSAAQSSPGLPEKLLLPLTRYVVRSRYRATPFGLFSGVGTVRWGDSTLLSLKEKYGRRTTLDMDYLCAFARQLERDPLIREHLIFYPNSSFYFLGEDIRYVERGEAPVLSSVKNDHAVRVVLEKAAAGADFPTLTEPLLALGVSGEEARLFLHELADTQLLVSELEPTITGEGFSAHLSRVLERLNHPAAKTLRKIRQKLRHLDKAGSNDLTLYAEITELIRTLGVTPDESRLFHTVRVNPCRESANTLSCEYQAELLRVIPKLGFFASENRPAGLKDFISRFFDRYENEEVPLLAALDTESGIGYHAHVSEDYTPLTEGIFLSEGKKDTSSLKWKELQQVLFRSLQKAQKEGAYEIPLPCHGTPEEMPVVGPSFTVMFRLIDKQRLLIENIGGSSGAHLAGRFGHASVNITRILRDIAEEENKNNPGVIFAEIVHLPDGRTGNILCRPAFRDYEIPYLAQSGLPLENQIRLQDLCVSVKNNRVLLRHGNKIVVPRLGCAHNFKNHSLPVYRFLCDLQTQDFRGSLDFSWGDIAQEFLFLPRVSDGQVIISPAMWQLSAEHLQPLQQPGMKMEQWDHWQKQHRLPRFFVLSEGDNELFIDSSNSLLLRVFLDSVKGKNKILIKEFLGDETIPVRNENGCAMINQFIAFLVRNDTLYKPAEEIRPESPVQRTFSLGSEWVYLKLYCGNRSADLLLEKGIAPVVHVAETNRWIDQWFFVRYQDSDNHLRIRFHLTDTGFLQNFLRTAEYHIQPFEKKGLVWKIQADTYRRELERYGYQAIEPSEHLFCIDSRMYLEFLHQTDGDEREELKWLWGLRNIDRLLHAAGLNTTAKQMLIEKARNRFAEEFSMDRNLKSQIDRRYRFCRKKIEEFMAGSHTLLHIMTAYELQLQNLWQEVCGMVKDESVREDILISHIHMAVNRLISSGQRLHELMMYDFLSRHYTSLAAMGVS